MQFLEQALRGLDRLGHEKRRLAVFVADGVRVRGELGVDGAQEGEVVVGGQGVQEGVAVRVLLADEVGLGAEAGEASAARRKGLFVAEDVEEEG